MYHGTRQTPPSLIYTSEEGFDMRFSPGGMWGRANYFAVNSSYSNSYRHDSARGEYQIFNAIVIEGKSAKLQSNNQLTMPPLLP
jgi:hypothetical protein